MHHSDFTIKFVRMDREDVFVKSLICPRVGETVDIDGVFYLVRRVVYNANTSLIREVAVWLENK